MKKYFIYFTCAMALPSCGMIDTEYVYYNNPKDHPIFDGVVEKEVVQLKVVEKNISVLHTIYFTNGRPPIALIKEDMSCTIFDKNNWQCESRGYPTDSWSMTDGRLINHNGWFDVDVPFKKRFKLSGM